MTQTNKALFLQSEKLIPGGVNSPVRAYGAVGGCPPFIKRGAGAYIWDEEDKQYLDYVLSWGPLVLGHAHPEVVKAVQTTAALGLSFGAPTKLELEMAALLSHLVPSLEMVRLVSSGTEATMSAIRLARGYTGRSHIVKFEGCYHGHADALLVKAGSGGLTFGQPTSAGVPPQDAQLTLALTYNDTDQLERVFSEYGERIAAVIVEPVAGNMNLILPEPSFLEALRRLCSQHGSVLIFDEVMSGFRVALGGAQSYYGIQPDLTTLGKVIGGGMPVGAFGGRRDIMQSLSPLGPVYQAGTLSGNPVAVAAGLATLKIVSQAGFFKRISEATAMLVAGLSAAAARHKVAFSATSIGSMFGIYFHERVPNSYLEVLTCNQEMFKRFFHGMLKRGIYLAPSAFETGFLSASHGPSEIDRTIVAADEVLAEMAK